MPQAAFLVVSTALSIRGQNQAKRANQQRAKLQRLQERRERNRIFAEQQRALADSIVGLGSRGAASSSAASTIPGSINTQAASEQGFLSNVSKITSRINAFEANAQRSFQAAQVVDGASNFYKQGAATGLFSKGNSK